MFSSTIASATVTTPSSSGNSPSRTNPSRKSPFRWAPQMIVALGCLLALVATSAHAQRGIVRILEAEAGGELRVTSSGSDIEVTGTQGNEVRVRIVRGGDSGAAIEKDYRLSISGDGEDVRVKIEPRRSWNPLKGWNKKGLDIEIAVPIEYEIDVTTSGGDVEIKRIEGEVRSSSSGGNLDFVDIIGEVSGRTSGGDVFVGDVDGDVEISTSGGDIKAGTVTGSIKGRTSGGKIEIDRVGADIDVLTSGGAIDINEALGAVVAHTSGGGIRARLSSQPQEDCRMTTSGGNMVVYLSDNLSLDIDASASGSGISTDFPLQITKKSGSSRIRDDLNGGGPALYLRTTGGNIRLMRAD